MSRFVIAAFKPKAGMQRQLLAVVERHRRVLEARNLVTRRPRHAMQAADGTVLELVDVPGARSGQGGGVSENFDFIIVGGGSARSVGECRRSAVS